MPDSHFFQLERENCKRLRPVLEDFVCKVSQRGRDFKKKGKAVTPFDLFFFSSRLNCFLFVQTNRPTISNLTKGDENTN